MELAVVNVEAANFLKTTLIASTLMMLTGCLKPDKESSSAESLTSLTISGKVSLADGTAAAYAQIFTDQDLTSRLLTNENGEYSLTLSSSDLATLGSIGGDARSAFFLFFEMNDGANLRALSNPINSGTRGTLSIDPVTLQTPASVEGKVLVLRNDGQIMPPAEGVNLRIGRTEVISGADGSFALTNLPPGKIAVRGTLSGSATLNDSWMLLPGQTKKFDMPILMFPETGIHGLIQLDSDQTATVGQGKTPYTKSYSVRNSPQAMFFRYHHKREDIETDGKVAWRPIQQKIEYDFGSNGGHTLFYQFADQSMQALSQLYSQQTIIDPLGSSSGIIINDGSGVVRSLDITVKIDVPPTAFRMKVAESEEELRLIEWTLPQPVYNHRLRAFPNQPIGSRTIYVQFADVLAFLSPVYTATIIVNIWPQPFPPVFVINNGAAESKSRLVKLDIQVPTLAYEMQIFEASESGGNPQLAALGLGGGGGGGTNTRNLWLAVKPEMFFKFSGPGIKVLYLQFRTRDQIVSPLYDQVIRIDPFPVAADGFIINNNAPSSRTRHLDLTLIPPHGSVQFKVSETGNGLNQSPWMTIVPNFVYSVNSEGLKTLYVAYQNIDGDDSPVFTRTIYVEGFPPETGDFIINGGQPVTISPKLHIDLLPPVNARHFMISEGIVPDERFMQWQEIQPDFALMVQGTGSKLVYVRFRSDDGLVSEAIQRTIFYDPFPYGSAGLVINNGASTTTDAIVNLRVFGERNLISMRITDNIDMINMKPFLEYRQNLTYELPAANGLHKIYIQFRTASGETSPVYFSEITKTAP